MRRAGTPRVVPEGVDRRFSVGVGEVAGWHDQAWYRWKRERVIEDLRVANGKATVPGVSFGSLGRGVMRMPWRRSLGDQPKTA